MKEVWGWDGLEKVCSWSFMRCSLDTTHKTLVGRAYAAFCHR